MEGTEKVPHGYSKAIKKVIKLEAHINLIAFFLNYIH